MGPIDALRLMVKHYRGGNDAVAAVLGKSPETLRKELAGAAGFKMGVTDACLISEACIEGNTEHCHAYANAVAGNCGGFLKLEVRTMAPEKLPTALSGLVGGSSDVLGCAISALADGVISDNELKACQRALELVRERTQELEVALQAANAAGKAGRP